MPNVEYGEYKGNKTIILRRGEAERYPFQFGVGKAKLVLEHLDAIRAFVEENGRG